MSTNLDDVTASLIGIPLDLGAKKLGVSMGPDTLRYEGLVPKLESTGLKVIDRGNVVVKDRAEISEGDNTKSRYASEIIRVSNESARLTEETLKSGQKAVVIGGDHSILLGAFSGASVAFNGELGLIYFDAHGDMNTEETTLTGNIHGMHLASLLGLGSKDLVSVYGDQPKLRKDLLLHIGGSDFDQAELDLIEREHLQAFTLLDLLSNNLGPLFKMVDELMSKVKQVWISLDLDSIDEVYAPAAGMPNKKGLTYREIATIAKYIGDYKNVVGIDVVEYNPLHEREGKTAELAIELIATFFGGEYSWYAQYMERNKI